MTNWLVPFGSAKSKTSIQTSRDALTFDCRAYHRQVVDLVGICSDSPECFAQRVQTGQRGCAAMAAFSRSTRSVASRATATEPSAEPAASVTNAKLISK